jgi:small conductance mechanosensitive channel
MEMEEYVEEAGSMILTYAPKVLLAILVLIIGLWIIKRISRGMTNLMTKRNVDPSLIPFLRGLMGVLLKVMLVISVVSMLGVETTSFIAILGAAGLAVGLALSGTLQNFAGGVMILIFKPFKVGDFIDAQGHMGTVREIQIFNTIMKTPDNKTVIIPNGGLATGSMVNFSTEPTRRVDMSFGIGYSDDIDKAKSILMRLLEEDERVLKDPAPAVAVAELADSSVNFNVRPWVNAGDYWGVYLDMQEKVKKAFDAEGVSIPFPQMDVHVQK